MEKKSTIKINDKEYKIADLKQPALDQLTNLHVTDTEIERLKMRLAIAQTARNAYLRELVSQLPK